MCFNLRRVEDGILVMSAVADTSLKDSQAAELDGIRGMRSDVEIHKNSSCENIFFIFTLTT